MKKMNNPLNEKQGPNYLMYVVFAKVMNPALPNIANMPIACKTTKNPAIAGHLLYLFIT